MSENGFCVITQLLISFLNECEETQDFNSSKLIIILSQTFYLKSENVKVFLHQGIQGHPIWKNFDFWEKIINSTIFEELQKQQSDNFEGDKKYEAMNNKSLIFCQLVSFGNIMMMFSLNLATVRALIAKHAKTYHFSKSEIKGIVEAITETASTNSSIIV